MKGKLISDKNAILEIALNISNAQQAKNEQNLEKVKAKIAWQKSKEFKSVAKKSQKEEKLVSLTYT
jgi:hypothetical protein